MKLHKKQIIYPNKCYETLKIYNECSDSDSLFTFRRIYARIVRNFIFVTSLYIVCSLIVNRYQLFVFHIFQLGEKVKVSMIIHPLSTNPMKCVWPFGGVSVFWRNCTVNPCASTIGWKALLIMSYILPNSWTSWQIRFSLILHTLS